MIEVHSGGISSLHGDEKQYALDEQRSREMHVVRSLDLGPFPSGSSERSQRRLRLTFTGENSQPFPPQRTHEDSCNPLASGCSPFFCFAHKPAKNAAVKAGVDVMSVTVVRMTVAGQSLNRAYSVSHQRKLRRHKLKGP